MLAEICRSSKSQPIKLTHARAILSVAHQIMFKGKSEINREHFKKKYHETNTITSQGDAAAEKHRHLLIVNTQVRTLCMKNNSNSLANY